MKKTTQSLQTMQENAWANLTLRKATLADAHAIFRLAESLKINYDKVQDNGFLVYVTDEEGYKKRIQSTPYFYVAERNNEIIGYLFCFDDKTLKELAHKKILTGEDKTFDFLFKQKKPFLLADQMGVMRKYSYQGIGKALFEHFFADMLKSGIANIYAEVLHSPIRNEASINFCTSMGFEELAELKNSDKNTWGIYHIGQAE